jgi:hypothetical protein
VPTITPIAALRFDVRTICSDAISWTAGAEPAPPDRRRLTDMRFARSRASRAVDVKYVFDEFQIFRDLFHRDACEKQQIPPCRNK